MEKSEITKKKILAAAENAFSKKGYYGARVDEIAETGGINKRMIYAHFGNKENLYIAVLDEVYKRMADEESSLIKKNMDSIETVNKVIEHYFSFLSKNPGFVKIVMWENLNEAIYFNKSNARFMKTTAIELLKEKIRQGIESGVFKESIDINEAVVTINMLCFSYFSNIHTMAELMQMDYFEEKEQSKRCEHVKEIILNYLIRE